LEPSVQTLHDRLVLDVGDGWEIPCPLGFSRVVSVFVQNILTATQAPFNIGQHGFEKRSADLLLVDITAFLYVSFAVGIDDPLPLLSLHPVV
jgi:hypothetical protein